MNLLRVRQMGLDELVGRSRQEVSKWFDRTCGRRGSVRWEGLGLNRFRDVCSPRFFPGAVSNVTPRLVAERIPRARADVVAEADLMLRGRFDLLGYKALDFGAPIDWHLDPVSSRRAPLVHWSQVDPLAFSQVGDSKVVWELNRHQWMVRLGQAYRLTGDERYAQAAADHLWHWIEANPPGSGINWASSLEVSYRLIAWCWSLFLLEGSRALSADLFAAALGQIWMHASHVERYLSQYFSPNTHLTGEALGLYYAGQIWQEFPQSQRWLKVGARILTDECERQILPDGTYFERATGYQRYTLEIYLHFLVLAARNGQSLPPVIADRTERMLDFVLALRLPDGSVPQIGDADSGTLVPLSRRAQDDFRGVLSIAAVVFRRADCAWAAGGATSDLLWLLGPEALPIFDALCPTPPAGPPSRLFEEGGFAVMRSDWQPDGQMLTFDVGPLGGSGSAGHGHADLLSVQCAAFGEPFLVDAGTFCYTGDPVARDFFRGSASHSTITVDGRPQAAPSGPFRWSAHPRAKVRDWCSTPLLDFADAEYHAHGHLSGFDRHRRRVLYVKARYWVIVDDLEGHGEHQVDLRFQFAPVEVRLNLALCACAKGVTGNMLMLQPFSAHRMTATVHCGELDPMQGWISREYGQRQPAPAVQYTVRAPFPFRIATLLAPVRHHDRAPIVSAMLGSSREPVGIAFEETGERITFGEVGVPVLERTTAVPANL